MQSGKVTVIVPVYNTEKYLSTCIDSLLGQSYSNIEIILVNDGSKDASQRICEEYARKDSRIRYFTQENKGVSVARNVGLEQATGAFICFVDADDMLRQDTIELAVKHLGNADLLFMGYEKMDTNGVITEENKEYASVFWNRKEAIDILMEKSEYGYQGYIGNKLFRADIIRKKMIRFTSGIYYNEDRLFNVQFMLNSSRAILHTQPVYCYRVHQESAMANTGDLSAMNVKRMLTEIQAFEIICELLKKQSVINYSWACQLTYRVMLRRYQRIPKEMKSIRAELKAKMLKYCGKCLMLPLQDVGVIQKIKIIGHYILKR